MAMANQTLDDAENQRIIEELEQEIHQLNREVTTANCMNKELHGDIERAQVLLRNREADLKQELTEEVSKAKRDIQDEREQMYNTILEMKSKIDELRQTKTDVNLPKTYEGEFETTNAQISLLSAEKAKLTEELTEREKILEKSIMEKQVALENCRELERGSEEMKKSMKLKNENIISKLIESQAEKDEVALLKNELSALKAVPLGDLHRGNSLFAKVEDNRQFLVSKLAHTKKMLLLMEGERDKLKLENLRLLNSELEENPKQAVYREINDSKNKVFNTLFNEAIALENRTESPQVVTSSQDDLTRLGWIDTMIENARAESSELRHKLRKRAMQRVSQGTNLFRAQEELCSLRADEMKTKAIVEDLRKQLEVHKKKALELEENEQWNEGGTTSSDLQQTKGIRFADDVKTDDSDTRKKGLKRLPKPQSYPKIVISTNPTNSFQEIQKPITDN